MTPVLEVLDADVASLSHDGRLSALDQLARLRDRVDAQEQRLLAALALDDPSAQEWVCDEVACALALAPTTAAHRLRDARDLAVLLPSTATAVRDGRITVRNAAVLLDLVRSFDADVRARVETRVLDRATGRTTAEFRRAVRRAVAALDERGLEERHVAAADERRVTLRPVTDGMSELWALLPADGAARVMAAISAIAGACDADDPRTGDQRRADALVGLADAPAGPASGGRAVSGPSVHVTVGLDTLLGFDDHAGELAGHGPVPAAMARRLAADPSAGWRRIVTTPAGTVCDAEVTYRPSARLRALITARDVSCRFPGCSRPARRAETDHVVAWEDGGPTSAANLQALCSRHHHLKHEAGWSVSRSPGGVTTWRSPTGRRYAKPPDDAVADYADTSPPVETPLAAAASPEPTEVPMLPSSAVTADADNGPGQPLDEGTDGRAGQGSGSRRGEAACRIRSGRSTSVLSTRIAARSRGVHAAK